MPATDQVTRSSCTSHSNERIPDVARNRPLLERACKTANIQLGAYDRRILDWLAGYEDSVCAVAVGLISRAPGLRPVGTGPAGARRLRLGDR